ncbi:MAG: hypothetical protein H8E36_00540 [Rhodospirillaceae bacterium]|nr:hypothetical protein [Rhodospirillaceae bacterium]MBL6931191.1 hypothetical protein [Rhodospirillales bacterium]MBL6942296.1 hypothetical protein [Rhodospirillales bacterium]
MAIEIRRLIVSKDELKQISNDFIAAGESDGPTGIVTELKVIKKDPISILVQIKTSEDPQTPFSLNEDQLILAFIRYCATKKIPVSRSAKKTVKITDKDMIAFDMLLQSTI